MGPEPRAQLGESLRPADDLRPESGCAGRGPRAVSRGGDDPGRRHGADGPGDRRVCHRDPRYFPCALGATGTRAWQGCANREAPSRDGCGRPGACGPGAGQRADSDGRAPARVSPGARDASRVGGPGRAGEAPLRLHQSSEPGPHPYRGERALELRAARCARAPPPAGRGAHRRVVSRWQLSQLTGGRRHDEHDALRERRASAHLRELAPPVQGSQDRRRGRPQDGGVRGHPRRRQAAALSASRRVARSGPGSREGGCRDGAAVRRGAPGPRVPALRRVCNVAQRPAHRRRQWRRRAACARYVPAIARARRRAYPRAE